MTDSFNSHTASRTVERSYEHYSVSARIFRDIIPRMRRQISVSFFVLAFLSSYSLASAWTGPTTSAPGNNVAAPLNVGTASQVKNGVIGVNGISVFGNSLLYGSGSGGNAYLNFGTTAGTSGYGIWDNGGTLNFKNSGGSWQSLQSIVSGLGGGGSWTTSGNNIYNSNAGNVGIGTTNPVALLDISGSTDSTHQKTLRLDGNMTFDIPGNNPPGVNKGIYWKAAGPTGGDTGYGYIYREQNTGKLFIGSQGAGTILETANGGNVGIGTTNPGYLLDVNGTAHVASTLTVSGAANIGSTLSAFNGLNLNGRFNVTGAAGDWAAVINWGPGSVSGSYGILVGSSASGYSQFQNASGYYTLLDQSSNGVNTNGNIYGAGFYYQSDARLKHNIQTYVDPLSQVLQLRPVTFDWNDQNLGTSTQIGFIAQEVQQVVPQLVTTNSITGLLSVDYAGFAPLLVGSVQQLDQKITAQQQQLDTQQSEIEQLQAQIAALANK